MGPKWIAFDQQVSTGRGAENDADFRKVLKGMIMWAICGAFSLVASQFSCVIFFGKIGFCWTINLAVLRAM